MCEELSNVVQKAIMEGMLSYYEVIEVITSDVCELFKNAKYGILPMHDLSKFFNVYTRDVKCQYEKGDIESKCDFVVGLLNIDGIRQSIDFAIETRSMEFYTFAASFCEYLEKIAKFTDEDFENVVKQYIRNGGCLTSTEYRNLNLVMSRKFDPKTLCYYIEMDPENSHEFVIYKGKKYQKCLDHQQDLFAYINRKTIYLHRELWRDFCGDIDKSQYVIFKDDNKDNLSLKNLEAVDRKVYLTGRPLKTRKKQ